MWNIFRGSLHFLSSYSLLLFLHLLPSMVGSILMAACLLLDGTARTNRGDLWASPEGHSLGMSQCQLPKQWNKLIVTIF